MAGTRDAARYLAVNSIKPELQQEFEQFIREVIVPAVQRTHPELAQMWQALRPAGSGDGPPVYAFVFYGDTSLEQWDLDPIFQQAYGEEEGRSYSERLNDFFASQQQVYAFAGELPVA